MSTGYEQIYFDLLPALAHCDIVGQAAHLGLKSDPDGSIPIVFLGRPYRITQQGVAVEDGAPVHINNRSLIIHYILSQGRVSPRYSFVPIGRLAGIIEGRNAQEGWFVSKDLLEKTQGKYPLFQAAAKALGGSYEGKFGGGKCWRFHPFPRMPIQINFFAQDDEFPAEIQFLFDETAPYYMGFESLAFLSGSVLSALGDIVQRYSASHPGACENFSNIL